MSIGIIVAGHGRMGQGLLSALQGLGPLHENIISIDLQKDETEEQFQKRFERTVCSLETKKILCLVDLAGSVVFNTASQFTGEDFAVVAGVNLGMLVEADTVRQFSNKLQELVDLALLVGKEQILALENL